MKSSAASPIRLDPKLIELAKREGATKKRSAPKQIEYWAELGKAVEPVIDLKDAYEIIQGFMKISVESLESKAVSPKDAFDSLEEKRENGELSEIVAESPVYYEASISKPGLLDKVTSATGKRQTGMFRNGKFEPAK